MNEQNILYMARYKQIILALTLLFMGIGIPVIIFGVKDLLNIDLFKIIYMSLFIPSSIYNFFVPLRLVEVSEKYFDYSSFIEPISGKYSLAFMLFFPYHNPLNNRIYFSQIKTYDSNSHTLTFKDKETQKRYYNAESLLNYLVLHSSFSLSFQMLAEKDRKFINNFIKNKIK